MKMMVISQIGWKNSVGVGFLEFEGNIYGNIFFNKIKTTDSNPRNLKLYVSLKSCKKFIKNTHKLPKI